MNHTTIIDSVDSKHSWHPFTQMQEYLEHTRLHISKGEGCWLYDTKGNKYLDCNASIWTNTHGHNNQELNNAIENQIKKISHSTYLGLNHQAGTLLTEKLIKLAPEGLERVFFLDNGSGSIETALKLSFQYRQLVGQPAKKEVIAIQNGYHGDTFGAMSVSNNEGWHHWFKNWLFPCHHIQAPTCHEYAGEIYHSDMTASLTELDALLEDKGNTVSCLVMEPLIQGPAGMQLQPYGFLKAVSELCKKHDVHLILDEIFVAMGRTGTFFACQHESISPDFLCISKGLTGGYLPLAATLTTNKIFEAFLAPFHDFKAFIHGHTYCANPVACATANKNLELLEALINSQALEKTIHYFGKSIKKHFENHPNIKEIRQRGLACAIDLYPGNDKTSSFPINKRIGLKVCLEARKHGLLIRPLLDSILIVPPLVISNEEIDFLNSQLVKAINIILK